MKRYPLFIGVLLVFSFGCVSMPDPVNDRFLANQTKEEEGQIKQLEEKIVSKKIEIDGKKENVSKAERKATLSRSELSVLSKKRSLLVEEQKLANLKENSSEAEIYKDKVENIDMQMQKQKLHLNFCILSKENEIATARVTDSELSLLVAELNYEKAKVAEKFVEKKQKEQGIVKKEQSFFSKIFGSSDDDGIDIAEYKSFFDNTRNKLKADKENQYQAEIRMIQAEKEFNAYTVDEKGAK